MLLGISSLPNERLAMLENPVSSEPVPKSTAGFSSMTLSWLGLIQNGDLPSVWFTQLEACHFE